MASKNVAAQKLVVRIRSSLGTAVDYGWMPAKVISISEKSVILRPCPPSRPFDMPKVTIPIGKGHRTDYVGGWGTHTEIDAEGLAKIRALHDEFFPGTCAVAKDGIHQRKNENTKCMLCGAK